jgi:formyltetrahydrofolate deformylase
MKRPGRTATLLISCPDQKGLVAAVSDFLWRRNANLVHSDQHTDHAAGLFLQRVEWELDDFRIPLSQFPDEFRSVAEKFEMTWELRASERSRRIAILVSKLGHCLVDLLGRWQLGEFSGDIPLVISNHADLAAEAERFGVEFVRIPVTSETKPQQESAMLEQLARANVDLVVLARYMQVLSEGFLAHFPNRIINIHHSFLPAFAGARP